MKRVVQVVYNMDCGGIEKFIISMYDELLKEGINFDFIYMNDENVKSYYDDHILKNGGRIFYAGKLKVGSVITFIKNFRKIIKENGKYEALHVHSYYNCGFIAFLASCCGIKNIVTHAHSTRDNKLSNSVFRKWYRLIAKLLIKIFSNYKLACGYDAGKSLYGKSKFIIINNGIDTGKFANISDRDMNEKRHEINYSGERLIIHVGSFVEVKNHEYILKIADNLKNRGIDYKILLLGDGKLWNEIRNKITQLELNENVMLLGVKNDVEKYLSISDVFIMPSKYEGFPVSLIEAQAAGLPCVVSNHVDRAVNLNVNKVSFIDIGDTEIDEWCKAIISSPKKEKVCISLSKIKEKKMDSISNSLLLKDIYLGGKR